MWMILWGCGPGQGPDALPAAEPARLARASSPIRPVVREEWVPPAPTGMDLAAELFDEDVVQQFTVDLSEEAVEALRADPGTWVEGALVWRGVRFEPVGVHAKGNNSFEPIDDKPSLRIKLNHAIPGLDLLGEEDLTLDNMSTDASMMRERLAYRVFREHGLPAARAVHAEVTVAGRPRGLYTLVESVDEELLALWWPDPSGTMWEMADVDFVPTDVPDFELEAGEEDRAPLQGIADALLLPDPVAATAAADPFLDWEGFATFAAATAVVGQFDSYPWRTPGDDVHLYVDPADGRARFLPHGMDETFKQRNLDVYSGTGLLFVTCLATPACRADYEAAILDVQATTERFDLLGYAMDVQARIAPFVAADPERPYTTEQVDAAQQLVLEFVEGRREHLERQLGGP